MASGSAKMMIRVRKNGVRVTRGGTHACFRGYIPGIHYHYVDYMYTYITLT